MKPKPCSPLAPTVLIGLLLLAPALPAQQVAKPFTPAIAGEKSKSARPRGTTLDALVGKTYVKPQVAVETPKVKVEFIRKMANLDVQPAGLGAPVHLSPRTPYFDGVAFVDTVRADTLANWNFFGLNGRDQESVRVSFKSSRANKPVLITLGINQAVSNDRGGRLNVKFDGAIAQSHTLQQNLQPSHLKVVVIPSDTQWYRVDISTDGLLLINYIELTPVL